MNILFFFSTTCVGGAETNFLKIGKELKKEGHNIVVVAIAQDGDLLCLFNEASIHSEIVGPLTRPLSLLKKTYKIIKDFQIETVFNFGLKVEIISRSLFKYFGVKYVISNIRSTDDWRKWYHNLLDRCTANSVDAWVSNSKAGKEAALARKTVNSEKLRVIYNFIDDDIIDTIDYRKIKPEFIKIGVLSNIKNGKGFEDLIELSQLLNKNNIKHQFIIGGQDKMKGQFHAVVESNRLSDNFKFLGYIEDKTSFFQEIDICLLPTYWEGFPTSLLEAMSFGKPIISTSVGGIPELISDGENGILLSPGNVSGFYNAIIKLINDEELVRNFRISGFEKLSANFSKSVVLKQWFDLLSDLKK